MKLILWDIDGTLIRNAPEHKEAFSLALQEIYHIHADWKKINPHGKTDPQILISALKKEGLAEPEIREKMTALNALIEKEEDTFGNWENN